MREGEVGTFSALFSRPAAFGPHILFSWEPALGLANSREEAAEEVKKKSLPFSPINSEF